MKKNKVLVLATSSKTRGGITSVIKAYQNTALWEEWNCIWIETHIDRSLFLKISYVISAFIKFIFHIHSANIVHIHLSGPVSVKRKYIFIKLTKWFKKSLIIHFHAFSAEANIDIRYKKSYLKIFNAADTIIVLSNSWKLGLINDLGILPIKIEVLYNPCPKIKLNHFIQKENIILYAGTLNKRKGYHDLINAFSKIDSKLSNWKLVFAGNGELEEARKMVFDLKIEDRVKFLGWVSGSQKNSIFQKSKIFCLPSYAEGFPMAILDAWSYALPIISTPVGGIPDVAIHKENMLLFKPGNITELQTMLEELIKDESLQEKLSMSSHKFSNNIFSIEKLAIQWDNNYEKLIKLNQI